MRWAQAGTPESIVVSSIAPSGDIFGHGSHGRGAAGRGESGAGAGGEALLERARGPGCGPAYGRDGGRARRTPHTGEARRDAGGAGLSERSKGVGGGCSAGHRRATARRGGCAGCGGHRSPSGQTQRRAAGDSRAGDGEARADNGAGAKLRRAGDETRRDARPEDAEAQHREGREHDGERLLDRRLSAAVARRELREEARADADDDGEHHDLHAGSHDIAEHLLGKECGLVEEGEGNDDEARERCELELDQGHEELHGQNEEGDEHQEPGHHEHGDLDEVRKEARKPHHLARRIEQRLTGVEADLGEMARLQEGRGRHRRAAGLQSEPREAVEDDAREVVEVGDDEGEEADVERLFHQPLQYVLVHAPGPEEPGERDVDHDQRRGKVADLAFDQAEAGIDVGREGVEERIDDADVVHGAAPD